LMPSHSIRRSMPNDRHAVYPVSTPDRFCIGGPEQKSITASSKKAPDIGGLLAFAAQS
jgi:hypothetical protein